MFKAYLTRVLLLGAWTLICCGSPFRREYDLDVRNNETAIFGGWTEQHLECEYLDLKDVSFLEKGQILIISYDTIMSPTQSHIIVGNGTVCFNRSDELKKEIFQRCDIWLYEKDEFEILENGSVVLLSSIPRVLEPGTYEIVEQGLHTCVSDENSTFIDDLIPYRTASVMLGKIGSSISIVALTAHLIIFCYVPPLRSRPGYNLASLSMAFLIAYSNVIVGQVPTVIGTLCIMSGSLQFQGFVVAFFCMNVIAFDVWRTLKLATSKLAIASDGEKKKLFIKYIIYSWGVPLIITLTVIIFDSLEGVSSWIKPRFGDDMICWITNKESKIIFFSVPAFILFIMNAVFFVLSAVIIKNNTMQHSNDESVRLNFVLYVRLGLMMGVTWLLSVLATLTDSVTMWLISDFLNPLQGLFIFILFTCSPRAVKYLKQVKGTPKLRASDKKSSNTHTANSSTSTTKETYFTS